MLFRSEKIAELEKIVPTAEEIEAEYKRLAENYGVDVDRVKAAIPEKEVVKDLSVSKAVDLVKESARVTEAKAEKSAEEKPKTTRKRTTKKAEEKKEEE